MSINAQSVHELLEKSGHVSLRERILGVKSAEEKLAVLEKSKGVADFLADRGEFFPLVQPLSASQKILFYSILALGQGERLFASSSSLQSSDLETLLSTLEPVEEFYKELGGLVGYHVTCLELLKQKGEKTQRGRYLPPQPFDISQENRFVREESLFALRHMEQFGEIIALGGAADRLALYNEETGNDHTAAVMEFCGQSLLQRLIGDLQAREFLSYRLFDLQVRVPLAIMTSNEKHNDAEVRAMFKEKNWFGRREEDFFLFSQPLVPAMNKRGEWCIVEPQKFLLKPGGHGVIWKLMRDFKVLEWFKERGKTKALVRQINNLIAGVDYGLPAFLGIGLKRDCRFGFAACPRMKGVSEGVNVVIETEEGAVLTNIEYCDFAHFQIEDEDGGDFLTNTNLLFVDLEGVESWTERDPIPGLLVNAKSVKIPDASGKIQQEEVLRLESTMQNLADSLFEPSKGNGKLEKSFITNNLRSKTISTIKKEFAFGSSMMQTPEQCFLDFLKNARDLLVNYCDFEVPGLREEGDFLLNGPSFIFLYHPALGPFYQVIRQKVRKGRFAHGSECLFEIADLFVENLDLDGSLSISTEAIMGHQKEDGEVEYSHQTGKCTLKNVRVLNSGIHREATRSFWKDEIVHREKCEIIIEEGGEFYAEDITLRGNLRIRVPSGVKITAVKDEGGVELVQELLTKPSWRWVYTIDEKKRIILNRCH
ncbi:MAG: hypothetical protein KR126chlam1_00189 [Chlamydiae bacterium]|nr:hypothetical protein [Chlamydiota bacterium]